MEPFSVLAIATSAAQFIDFGSKLLKGTIEIRKSGQLDQHKALDHITESLANLTAPLDPGTLGSSSTLAPQRYSPNDVKMQALCQNCYKVATQLQEALVKLKMRRDTNWGNLKKALMNVWDADKVKGLQEQLSGYRQELILLMLVALRESVVKLGDTAKDSKHLGQQVLDNLSDSKQWRDDLLEALRETHRQEHYDHAYASAVISFAKRPNARLVEPFIRTILQNLRYREMSDREERIPDRYRQTFDWIYHEAASSQWTSFTRWLKSDSGTYWVTGKPGAGKSTLMKFLHQDPRTVRILRSSLIPKGRSEIIVAGFFFWNSGTKMQMSQEGMVRTILHRCLEKCSNLIPSIFPALWEEYHLFEILPSHLSWTWDELARVFKTMFDKGASRDFLLFIDGLDEFSGNHAQLIDLLQSKAHLPNVKMCVASRPWPVFEDAFHETAKLQIQDLTYPDMIQYVKGKLNSNPGFKSLRGEDPEYSSNLVYQIVQKSEGVFLWVTLVVALLLEDITNGSSILDLSKHLEELPPELESFFDKILSTIQKEHFTHASQLFRLVHAAMHPITLLELSLVDGDNPSRVLDLPIRALPQDQANYMADRMRRRISSRCKGLLEAGNIPGRDLSRKTVQYLHRTTKDFLESPSVQKKLEATDPTLDSYLVLALARLGWTKVVSDISMDSIRECVGYADQSVKTPKTDPSLLVAVIDQLSTVTDTHNLQYSLLNKHSPNGTATATAWNETASFCKVCPETFLSCAVKFQLHWYLVKKLDKYQLARPSEEQAHSLLQCAIMEWDVEIPQSPGQYFQGPNLSIIQALLDAGADPNDKKEAGNCPSIWEIVVRITFSYGSTGARYRTQKWLELIDIGRVFLDYGADVQIESIKDVQFWLGSIKIPDDTVKGWLASYEKAKRDDNGRLKKPRASPKPKLPYKEAKPDIPSKEVEPKMPGEEAKPVTPSNGRKKKDTKTSPARRFLKRVFA
ncbi:hypothetical protein N0V90_001537 [Kalmusia sp. IMI 367209]|nr:hypothetical protein N0V90_001537 [Kalmusia sp. IMI 367209]